MNDEPNGAKPTEPPKYYVAIGASAGGLEAIDAFFGALTPGTSFAYVIVQHLSPDYKSLMVQILSKKTPLPVHCAEDGTFVERGHVYLIPPRKNLTISGGKLCLSEQDHSSGLNLPIDVFLRSLAEDQGEKAIDVILSGTGSDGMPPAAISTGLADFILPPEQMPRRLVAFTEHPQTIEAPRSDALLGEEDDLTRIFALLRNTYNVDFTYYKPATVTRRIQRRMTVNRLDDLGGYVRLLLANRGELDSLFRELLVGAIRRSSSVCGTTFCRTYSLQPRATKCASGLPAAQPEKRRTRWPCWPTSVPKSWGSYGHSRSLPRRSTRRHSSSRQWAPIPRVSPRTSCSWARARASA
jgi:hypothetical protein